MFDYIKTGQILGATAISEVEKEMGNINILGKDPNTSWIEYCVGEKVRIETVPTTTTTTTTTATTTTTTANTTTAAANTTTTTVTSAPLHQDQEAREIALYKKLLKKHDAVEVGRATGDDGEKYASVLTGELQETKEIELINSADRAVNTEVKCLGLDQSALG